MMIDVGLGNVCIKVLTLDESQKEFVDHLNMRPGYFQYRLVLFGIEYLSLGGDWRRNWPEEILCEHFHYPGVHGFGDDRAVVGNIIQEFVERQPLDFLGFHIGGGIVEVEYDITLIDLLHEKILAAVRGDFMEAGKFLEIPMALFGNVKSRGMLAFRCPDSLRHVLGGSLKPIEDMGFPWGSQIPRHRLGVARRGRMMLRMPSRSVYPQQFGGTVVVFRPTGALGLIITLGFCCPCLVGVDGPLFAG